MTEFNEKVSEIENLVSHYGSIRVDGRSDRIHIIGRYDDLDPEPQRSRVQENIAEIRRKIEFDNVLSFDYDSLTERGSYGSDRLIIVL